jgi:hypothetical protein
MYQIQFGDAHEPVEVMCVSGRYRFLCADPKFGRFYYNTNGKRTNVSDLDCVVYFVPKFIVVTETLKAKGEFSIDRTMKYYVELFDNSSEKITPPLVISANKTFFKHGKEILRIQQSKQYGL